MSTLDNPISIEPNNVSARSIGVRYGAIASLLLIAVGLIFHVAGLTSYTEQYSTTNIISSVLNYAIMIGAIAMAMKTYRDQAGGFMTFGKGFNVGFWASLIMGVITAVWVFIFFTLVAPDLTDTILEATRENMLEQGQSEEQVDQAMQYSAPFMNATSFSIFAAIGTLIAGLIISLIVAAVMQRKPLVDTIA
jgi:Ca2+/Na+ antiporter